jgi:hypothetical protein
MKLIYIAGIWEQVARGSRQESESGTMGRLLRELRKKELHNLCPSLNIIRMITSRRMKW